MRVYLAGKMAGRWGYEVLGEREHAIHVCEDAGILPIDPAINEGIREDQKVDIKMSFAQMRAFVSKDEFAIRHCDALLVLTGDTPSEGTGQEIALACQLGKPVVLVSPARVRGDLMGFWNVRADAIFATVEEAVQFLAENYGG